MIFTSLEFLVFFGFVVAVRWPMQNQGLEKWFLLVASWLFYMSWNPPFVLLLLGITTSDYFIGKAIARSNNSTSRHLLMGASLSIDLGILAFFKYANFLTDQWRGILSLTGVEADPVFWEIILPAGISFFVFQSLSYTFDIYRGKLSPTSSWRDYSLFVAFFPQLVAGPIVRAADFLPQLGKRTRPQPALFESGLALFLLGAFKKAVLSDQIAPQVNLVFASPSQFDQITLIAALLGFAAQIYLDFSGYSDMAIGCARMMGYRFLDNFAMPYKSFSITEFWHRWHISLSTWLRDYVYISFGGNRHGTVRTYVNLLVTMLLGGLWHGASWNFVLWGGIHGAALCVHKVWCHLLNKNPSAPVQGFGAILFGWSLTFVVVVLAWIPFRCANFGVAAQFFLGVVGFGNGTINTISPQLLAGLFILIMGQLMFSKNQSWDVEIPERPFWYRFGAYSFLAAMIVVFGVTQAVPFIYFQF